MTLVECLLMFSSRMEGMMLPVYTAKTSFLLEFSINEIQHGLLLQGQLQVSHQWLTSEDSIRPKSQNQLTAGSQVCQLCLHSSLCKEQAA